MRERVEESENENENKRSESRTGKEGSMLTKDKSNRK